MISYVVFFHVCLKIIGRSNETIFVSTIITLSGIGLYLAYSKITQKRYVDLAEDINKHLFSMSEKDTGEFLAFITNFSKKIKESDSVDLYDPESVKEKKPDFLEIIIKRLDNNAVNSPVGWSMLVWWFTLHAVDAKEYRHDVKNMWKKLVSGAPYLEAIDSQTYAALAGGELNAPQNFGADRALDNYRRIPKGFE